MHATRRQGAPHLAVAEVGSGAWRLESLTAVRSCVAHLQAQARRLLLEGLIRDYQTILF